SNAPSLDPIIYGISQSVIIADEIARLGKAGYTAAAAALAAGDLAAFFLMKERDATLSGQVAKCLEDAASACPDRTKASKLRELSVAARAR
ncbi:MAG: hypothetical protein GWN86_18510, partial [Desulfobacterales bacterium]|nr:hypothetical protein [Desulfobacterales bacterium]